MLQSNLIWILFILQRTFSNLSITTTRRWWPFIFQMMREHQYILQSKQVKSLLRQSSDCNQFHQIAKNLTKVRRNKKYPLCAVNIPSYSNYPAFITDVTETLNVCSCVLVTMTTYYGRVSSLFAIQYLLYDVLLRFSSNDVFLAFFFFWEYQFDCLATCGGVISFTRFSNFIKFNLC